MRVLLIESDPRLAETIPTSLEQLGYAVDLARSVGEGDEAAVVERPDLIIMDVADRGVETCRTLRRHKVAAPILMLSELHSTKDTVAGLDAGADDYLVKPFQLEELMARLRSLLRRSQATEGAMLRSGDLVLDLHTHRVTLGGAPVKLTGKEFALLEYLMRNPQRLLTRSMISESVWAMTYEPSSNVIDVYISSLRHKVDRDPKRPRIETVVGCGYRFLDQEPMAAPAPRARATAAD